MVSFQTLHVLPSLLWSYLLPGRTGHVSIRANPYLHYDDDDDDAADADDDDGPGEQVGAETA